MDTILNDHLRYSLPNLPPVALNDLTSAAVSALERAGLKAEHFHGLECPWDRHIITLDTEHGSVDLPVEPSVFEKTEAVRAREAREQRNRGRAFLAILAVSAIMLIVGLIFKR